MCQVVIVKNVGRLRVSVTLLSIYELNEGTRPNPEKSPLRERIAKVIDITALLGDRANTGCICEGGESAVIAIT